jgi:CO/xanthine dehydrogenase FAD-binding subunit
LNDWGHRAYLLAGGTDLLVQMRAGEIAPECVVDISAIEELRGLRAADDVVHVAALTTHNEIAQSQLLRRRASVLTDAAAEVGSVQVRNLATLGGNIGNASPCADTVPALHVLDAEIRLVSSEGDQWIPIGEFFTGPGETVRSPRELIAGVRFRASEDEHLGFFQKIGHRRKMRVSKASAAGTVSLEDGTVARCKLALGSVAPTVIRAPEAEKYLVGRPLTVETIAETAALASAAARPITDIRSTAEYRRRIIRVLVSRGLSRLKEVFVDRKE